jgi:ribosomal protein L31
MRGRSFLSFFILGVLLIGGGSLLHAQIPVAEGLAVSLYPAYPRPYQTVTVVPESTLIDLATANVTVSVNGSVVSEGSGAEPAYVTIGGPGTATTVVVRATAGGQAYSKTLTIRPADVSLIIESRSTSHPFYQGGSLVASEGGVRIVAIPDIRTANGAVVPSSNLVYTWRSGDQVLQASSGIGKSVLSASAPVRYRDARLTVTVSTQDRSIVAETSTTIAPADPMVRLYRSDPLLGPWYQTALPETLELAGDEETFRAVPYHFSAPPAIAWTLNGDPADTGSDITVRAAGSEAGTAVLTASAKSPLSQDTTDSVRITFGAPGILSIFGL